MSTPIAAVLLAGGKGERLGSPLPKQFLQLHEKPIVLHSFETLTTSHYFDPLVVVCSEEYRSYFPNPSTFALPGERRQDSLFNALQVIPESIEWVLVHDAARPYLSHSMLKRVIEAAKKHGAATVGMPLKFTVKTVDPEQIVQKTPDRTLLWEIQTPQVVKRSWLIEGFAYCQKNSLTVTDDVSLAELIGKPVKVVKGSYQNIKITTQEDLELARLLTT